VAKPLVKPGTQVEPHGEITEQSKVHSTSSSIRFPEFINRAGGLRTVATFSALKKRQMIQSLRTCYLAPGHPPGVVRVHCSP
jgi:hypothetical protein